jgi:hypothetical protein
MERLEGGSSATLIGEVGVESAAEWRASLLGKLDELGDLEVGWDSYDAPPPDACACDWAREALRLLAAGVGFPPTRLAASGEGGIAISWRSGRRTANVEFFNTGEILAAASDDMGHPEVWEVRPDSDDLARAMETIREFIDPTLAGAPPTPRATS